MKTVTSVEEYDQSKRLCLGYAFLDKKGIMKEVVLLRIRNARGTMPESEKNIFKTSEGRKIFISNLTNTVEE